MKNQLSVAVLLVVACSTTSPPPTVSTPDHAPAPVSATSLEDHAGDSTGTAVDVPETAPEGGVPFENEWIFERYGRVRKTGSGTGVLNGRRYDVVNVELPNGDKKIIYFDITSNWNDWAPPPK